MDATGNEENPLKRMRLLARAAVFSCLCALGSSGCHSVEIGTKEIDLVVAGATCSQSRGLAESDAPARKEPGVILASASDAECSVGLAADRRLDLQEALRLADAVN